MAFKLRQMEVFRAVMLTGSVSGAARMLYVSQPAVSKLLAHTETSLGIKLFNRIGGKLQATADAHLLYEQVQTVYSAAQKVDRFVENLAVAHASEISIGSSPSLGLSLMPKIIDRYLQRDPGVRVHFNTTMVQDVPLEILSGTLDAAVTVLPVENAGLTVERLFSGRMVCAMRLQHPLAARPAIRLRDLTAHKTICYSLSIPFERLIRETMEAHGFDIKPAIDVPRAELACAMAQRGLGVAIVDEFSVADKLWSEIVVRPIVEEISFDVYLITPRFQSISPSLNIFVEVLREWAKDLPQISS
ncbi:LysR substrate-binding domain-containing protein [Bordetella genomosp. 5]|uniref:LysR substrate-binding domain-containing protein n=1 Tax=Bordetella genomosp. 5 TaxID=1395608 RepID=UPI001594E7ED|nr:LysR substrate-binding domain-containing protein [Bordetella genomosp. 5]